MEKGGLKDSSSVEALEICMVHRGRIQEEEEGTEEAISDCLVCSLEQS